MGLLDGGLESILLVLLVLYLFLGPEQLPKLARHLGRLQAQWKRHQKELERTFREAADPIQDMSKDDAFTRETELRSQGDPLPTADQGPVRAKAERQRREALESATSNVDKPDVDQGTLRDTARTLGIDPSGKNEAQLRAAIKDAL